MKIIYSYLKKKTVVVLLTTYRLLINFIKKNPLYYERIENIIETFDEISRYWISEDFKSKHLFIENSLGFIIP